MNAERFEWVTLYVLSVPQKKRKWDMDLPTQDSGYVQVVDSETYKDLNRIDIRGYKGKGPRQYKTFKVDEPKVKVLKWWCLSY